MTKEKKNPHAQGMAGLSWKSRKKGKSKKEISEMMRELVKKRKWREVKKLTTKVKSVEVSGV